LRSRHSEQRTTRPRASDDSEDAGTAPSPDPIAAGDAEGYAKEAKAAEPQVEAGVLVPAQPEVCTDRQTDRQTCPFHARWVHSYLVTGGREAG
jgi:hypothetical protein